MGEVDPVSPTVLSSFCSCYWWQWEGLKLVLHHAHGCIELHQLRHHCRVGTVQYWICLCQILNIVTLGILSLYNCMQWIYCIMMIFWWRGRQYTINVLNHRGVIPLSCSGDRLTLLSVVLVEKYIESWPNIEVVLLLTPVSDFIIEGCSLCQKGNPFWHHHGVDNFLPSWSCKSAPLSWLVYEAGEELWGVISPHHIHGLFLKVNF